MRLDACTEATYLVVPLACCISNKLVKWLVALGKTRNYFTLDGADG